MIAAGAALVAGALWRRSASLLRFAGVPMVRAVSGIGGGFAYCLLAGWGVPAQRTLIMICIVALALCARLRMGFGAVLGWAAVFVCLWDPWAVLSAGFWLSFGAVACILAATHGRVEAPGGWRATLRQAVGLQGAITLGQVPFTLAIFGQVSLVAPLANAVAIPAVSYLVAPVALAGAGLLAIGGALAPIGEALLHVAEWVFGILAALLELLVQLPLSYLAFPMPPAPAIFAAAAGCLWFLALPGWRARGIGLLWIVPMLVWPVSRPGAGELWVTALDVGQGMSLVLETATHVVVFDAGPRFSPDADAAERVLVPYLHARGIGRVDALFISHKDADHAGGAASLLSEIPVTQLWSSMEPGNRLLAGRNDVARCEAGRVLTLGELRVTMLSPDAGLYDRPRASTNSKSCVILARLGAHGVLLTGDVPVKEERALVSRFAGELHADLMVAPHHGSHTSSSAELIDAASPRWTSMQVGYRNRFGHPHEEILARYRERGIGIVRSDESGAAQWRFGPDGGVELERWRIDHARYWHNRPGRTSVQSDSSGTAATSGA